MSFCRGPRVLSSPRLRAVSTCQISVFPFFLPPDKYFFNLYFFHHACQTSRQLISASLPQVHVSACSTVQLLNCSENLRSKFSWSPRSELNRRPHPYQGCALTKLSYMGKKK
jgi:hypothetical protein